MADDSNRVSMVKKHHEQANLNYNRPKYREARWERAVKVYTINLESKYVLIQGIPAVGASKELLELFALYGAINEYRILDDYPSEPFTEVYWIKFQRINSARSAKKKLDNRSFFGGILHVCYAPEFETVDDTREKFQERRKIMAKKTRELFGAQEKTYKTKVAPIADSSTKSSQEDSREAILVSSSAETTASSTNSSDPVRGLSHGINYSMYTMPSSTFNYPTLPPPPQHVHPYQYPPPPPPWELPRVPSAHATLPAYLQSFTPPPPPPIPPPPPPPSSPPKFHSVESPTSQEASANKSEVPRQEKGFPVYMSKVMIGPQHEEGSYSISTMSSLTGDDSLDKTAYTIRNKFQKLSGACQSTNNISSLSEQNVQLHIIQNPNESTPSSVSKKKRKRI
ncbi:RNA-binding protein 48 [Stylophora pistillata]|uniref:RNA-binding protein 48 n=2 Tax=Stylophora pistillata TaxID=50429 RepID=A0A2B4SEH0_STYPI|nr:RNA-binding protein 48 [Stylophora pistillata]